MPDPDYPERSEGDLYETKPPGLATGELAAGQISAGKIGSDSTEVSGTVAKFTHGELDHLSKQFQQAGLEMTAEMQNLLSGTFDPSKYTPDQLGALRAMMEYQLALAEQTLVEKEKVVQKEETEKEVAITVEEQRVRDEAAAAVVKREEEARLAAAAAEEEAIAKARREAEEKAAEEKKKADQAAYEAAVAYDLAQAAMLAGGVGFAGGYGSAGNWQSSPTMMMALNQGFVLNQDASGGFTLPVKDAAGNTIAVTDGSDVPANAVPIVDASGTIIAVTDGTSMPAGTTPVVDATGNVIAINGQVATPSITQEEGKAPTVGSGSVTELPDQTISATASKTASVPADGKTADSKTPGVNGTTLAGDKTVSATPDGTTPSTANTSVSNDTPPAKDEPVKTASLTAAGVGMAGIGGLAGPVAATALFANVAGFTGKEKTDNQIFDVMKQVAGWSISQEVVKNLTGADYFTAAIDHGLASVGGGKALGQQQVAL